MVVLIVCLFVWVSFVYGWWGMSHMLVAQVAELVLEGESPRQLLVARQMLDEWSDFFPRSSDFVPAATWADNIHENRFRAFAGWHFLDLPYLDVSVRPGGSASDKLKLEEADPKQPDNIVWALNQVFNGLKAKEMSQWGAAFFVRYAIHLLGDLHQPEHNIARYSAISPGGDRGGNLCKVSLDTRLGVNVTSLGLSNMHKVWDSAGAKYNYDPFFAGDPLTSDYLDQLKMEARRLMAEWPPQRLPTFAPNDVVNVESWSREGFEVAVRDVWLDANMTGLSGLPIDCRGSALPLNYLDHVTAVSQRQIVLGGRRLAQFLQQSLPQYYEPAVARGDGPSNGSTIFVVVANPTGPSPSDGVSVAGAVAIAFSMCCTGALFYCAGRGLYFDCVADRSGGGGGGDRELSVIGRLGSAVFGNKNHAHHRLTDSIREDVV